MRRKPLLVVFALLAGAVVLAGTAGYFAFRAESGQVNHRDVTFDVSPDGSQVVFSSADADLYLFNLRTRQVRQLTRSVALETDPAFSPDGRTIVYASSAKTGGSAAICVRSVDGKQARKLTAGRGTLDAMPSYSSDGKQITFVRAARHRPYSMGGWTWDDYDVCVMNRDGSGLRRVTRHGYYQASHPHLLSDGNRIIFAASGDYPDTHSYLFSVPAGGSAPAAKFMPPPAPLDEGSSSPSSCASWGSDPYPGPGGRQIVFISDRSKSYDYDAWVAHTNGGSPRALGVTGISAYNQAPVFTPDGVHILFLAGTEQDDSSLPIFSLWEVDRDGSHAHCVAGSKLFTDPQLWKPQP